MRTALAISPHLDDAAFSAGATLARLARRGWRVVVATVFTRTVPGPQGFALACQTDKGLPPDADYMAIRRAEDEAACAALGAEARHLPYAEAPHRGYNDAPALFAGRRADDDGGGDVAGALADLCGAVQPDVLLGPRAIGAHVDHLVVREAMVGLPHRTAWWTDWPYAGRSDAPDPFATADLDARRLAVIVGHADVTAKLDACAAYASQIGFQFGGKAEMRRSVASVTSEQFVATEADASAGSTPPHGLEPRTY